MKIYNYTDLSKSKIEELCSRQIEDDKLVESRVADIVKSVKTDGDKALFDFAKTFDKVELKKLFLDGEELKAIAATIPDEAKKAINTAYENIKNFHLSQLRKEDKIETMPGVVCWRESRAIEKVGLYIPGGTAVLPSTFLMLATPALIAGCKEIIVCSPPQSDGKTNCYLAYCAVLLGIKKLFLIGGAQAVAAMAFGTESVPQAYKIFGPGNRYVTTAKPWSKIRWLLTCLPDHQRYWSLQMRLPIRHLLLLTYLHRQNMELIARLFWYLPPIKS